MITRDCNAAYPLLCTSVTIMRGVAGRGRPVRYRGPCVECSIASQEPVDVLASDPSFANLDRVEVAGSQLVVDKRMRQTESAGGLGNLVSQLFTVLHAAGWFAVGLGSAIRLLYRRCQTEDPWIFALSP